MKSKEDIIAYIYEWIDREEGFEKKAKETGNTHIEQSCEARVFTLQLLLSNIETREIMNTKEEIIEYILHLINCNKHKQIKAEENGWNIIANYCGKDIDTLNILLANIGYNDHEYLLNESEELGRLFS